MNWKLIFLLTLFGIAVAFAGVIGILGEMEFPIWLVIFIVYAAIIVKQTTGKYFLHAFLISIINGVWIGIIHAAFIATYLANNPAMKESYKIMPLRNHPRILMVIMGPIIGAITGLVAGLIVFGAGKLMKKKEPLVQP
ncbi:MAG: hypothetical protein WAO19_14275 [Candidatus Kryptoniota bacterium]